ncbi:MAG: aminotransferase class IV [Chitinophagaceae bacterium]|nr:aminotransferase class IV [Chitinophagaceae bacterium]
MSIFFNYNGKIYPEHTPVISPDNRSLRYGDGLFETMKVVNGKIILKELHFERLFSGMALLQFQAPPNFTQDFLEDQVLQLCKKNGHFETARIRLMIFRGNGGLYDAENTDPNYIIQGWSIDNDKLLNSNGLVIDIYNDARKSCDKFSNIKTNNFLPYVMAALYAKENKLNDCILLNTNERICDSTLANIFFIKDDVIYTPPLNEGCIAGVVRRWMIQNLQPSFAVIEKPFFAEELLRADEIFLTNSIFDMKWVKHFGNTSFTFDKIKDIYKYVVHNIY